MILDSSGLFHIRNAYIIGEISNGGYRLVTTSLVADEVKDIRSRALLDLINVEILDPDPNMINAIKLRNPKLSDADASIVALASSMATSGVEVSVVTDDVGLIKALRKHVKNTKIITINIKEKSK
ncbi:PilT protein domain protein [Caldivirga maquilingensis IC-167]|uniref:PilT protein domain protein n=2 Tax=Caldivirga maquilingensis TaxID=76887 RepID=A8MBT9_CALMQ|nr:PilT protein domain protein [Caldivirga maquilingensis IC-167]